MKNNILVSLSLIIFLICSCSKKEKGTARVEPVKDFVFDTISINDTMTHVFDVKNISDEDLIISNRNKLWMYCSSNFRFCSSS